MELAKAYVQIVPSAKGMSKGISDALGADSAGEKAGSSIASKIKGAIGVAAIGAALGKALTEGAALEQSIGGIETLFKGSADTVISNAKRAYETAGISANDYMETATSFSASLLQGLGGDTQAAAQITDMAITDMSDNANKMGTDMSSIQMAYQGFAKQNYTMLDNLKLGYGGTKEEMARLLADAQKITGVKYDMSNLSDVYSAIHVIQGELNITGTTSKEASTTMSGSFASMKAAAADFAGYLTTGMDVTPAIEALVDTSTTFLFDNLVPALENVITAIPGAVQTFIDKAVPKILNQGYKLVTEFLPKLIDSGLNMVKNIVTGISQNLPKIVTSATNLVVKLIQTIGSKLPQIVNTGIKLIGQLASGIVKAIPTVVQAIPKIIKSIKEAFSNVDWKSVGQNIINGIVKGVGSMAGALAQAARNAGANALSAIKRKLGIASPSRVFRDEVGRMIPLGIAAGIDKSSSAVSDSLADAIPTDYNGRNALNRNLSYSAPNVYGYSPANTISATDNIVNGIVNGLAPLFSGMDTKVQIDLMMDKQRMASVLYDSLDEIATRRGVMNNGGQYSVSAL